MVIFHAFCAGGNFAFGIVCFAQSNPTGLWINVASFALNAALLIYHAERTK